MILYQVPGKPKEQEANKNGFGTCVCVCVSIWPTDVPVVLATAGFQATLRDHRLPESFYSLGWASRFKYAKKVHRHIPGAVFPDSRSHFRVMCPAGSGPAYGQKGASAVAATIEIGEPRKV